MGSPAGPRPHIWKSGTDPVTHQQYVAWGRSRAQAHFRKEEWHLTWPEWQELWSLDWNQRGRGPDSVLITRRDPLGPWSIENCLIMDRKTFGSWQKQQVLIKRLHQTVV